ncbi:hypothetical protein GCM10027040_23650 [Halomonas shantousis]
MAKKHKAPKPPSSYELLGQRIQKLITSPRAQRDKHLVISRLEEESADDWARLLEEFETVEELTMIPHEDGSVTLRWNPAEAMG